LWQYIKKQKKEHIMRRGKIKKSSSKKMFKKGASKTHWKNLAGRPMRGGIRL
jgi:hypothetical protein